MPRHCVETALRILTACGASLLLAACGSAPSVPAEPVASAPVSSPAEQAPKPAKASKGSKKEAEEVAAAPVEQPVPPEAMQQFDRAVTLMSAGDTAAAEQTLRSLAAAYPQYPGALLNLGILHAKAGRLEEAEKALNGALERKPDSAVAFNQLGIVYRKLGRFKEADEAYKRAVAIDPNYALAWLNLGVLCDLYLQQPQRALEAYERYLAVASAPDQKVSAWVTELKARLGNEPRSARADQ